MFVAGSLPVHVSPSMKSLPLCPPIRQLHVGTLLDSYTVQTGSRCLSTQVMKWLVRCLGGVSTCYCHVFTERWCGHSLLKTHHKTIRADHTQRRVPEEGSVILLGVTLGAP